MAAIAAAESGAAVTACEQLDHPAAKLLVTGGGRCNLTNTLGREEFMARFGRQGRFLAPALEAMDSAGLRRFLGSLGVPTICADGVHVFPASGRAETVHSALRRRCEQLRVELRVKTRVTGLWLESGRLRGVRTAGGPLPAEAVVLASGGCSYRQLGGTGGGYKLARQAGHEIIPPTPALVPLLTQESWPYRCKGVSLPQVRVWIDLPGRPRQGACGELLFTHRGISGPAVLDVSGDVAALLARQRQVPIRIDLTASLGAGPERRRAPTSANRPTPEELIEQWRRGRGAKLLRTLLGELLPRSLAGELCALAGAGPQTRAAEASVATARRLAEFLLALPLTAVGTEGFARAMVTRGGVSLRHVEPRALASRLLSGLFFAGEVLDLDGPCGGFNLQWAFSSGCLAGRSAAHIELP